MYIAPIDPDQLLQQAQAEDLYAALIDQLNKDFNLANDPVDFPKSTNPLELKIQLQEKIYRMISFKYAEFLSLLYIIDVAEDEVKRLDGSDLQILSHHISFLVLKREWQKIWFRKHFK
jgi:hypothetical protein